MRISDLYERANRDFAGSTRVIDLRAEKRDPNETHITLTKDGGALIWNYASGNKLPWSMHQAEAGKGEFRGENDTLRGMISRMNDPILQSDELGIRYTQHGILISHDRDSGTWTGRKNRFSHDLRPVVERLLDVGIAKPRTPIYVGNWASRSKEGELIGSAAQIMKAPKMPNKAVFYHGTSSARAKEILENGLFPLDKDARVWNKDRTDRMPEHRQDSVYLTASMSQAEYYASKAVKIDRTRLTWRYRYNQETKIKALHRTYVTQRDYKNEEGMRQTEADIEKLKRANELLQKMAQSTGKLEPVILVIELTRPEYKNLMADDDYINKMKDRGVEVDPTDWRESLSDFGQVAYRGSIPASQIRRLR